MSAGMITLVIAAFLLMLILTGMPIAFSLLFVSVAGVVIWGNPGQLISLSAIIFDQTTKDYLIALPMFIFMAAVLQVSGLGTALYEMFYKWMAGLRGGLAMGTVGVATILAAMTGSSSTATVGMGLIAYPEMKRRGYSKAISIGCIPAGGCLGPLIPPSIPMILVAVFSYVSIGKLFIAGIFPGLLTSFLFMLYIGIRCFANPALGPAIPVTERGNWSEKFASLKGVILPIILIFLVLGLIYMGVCTPSEAGGVGAFGALLCTAINRNLTWKNLKDAILTALRLNAMIFWMIIGGVCFSSLLMITGVNQFIGDTLIGSMANRWVVLAMMLGIVFIMGMFVDSTPITIICVPMFIPIVRALGFDPLWFGLIFTMDLLLGFMTPPFGVALFYFKGIGLPGVSIEDVYRACIPFVILMVIAWILCIIFPPIAIWLPNQMIKPLGS